MNSGVRRLAKRTPRPQTLATAGLLAVVVVAAIILYQQRSPSPAAAIPSLPVTGMHFFSPSEGWVLSYGRLLVTRDGGAHWRNVTPGPHEPPLELHAVLFLDPARGWAGTVGGFNVPTQTIRIFRTADGGGTWTSSQIEVEAPLDISLNFVDQRHGWLVVAIQTITGRVSSGRLHTTDGGATWSELPPSPSSYPVRFLNLATGWTVGGAPLNELYITHAGGRTWQHQSVPIPPAYAGTTAQLSLPTLVDAQHGVLAVLFADGSVLLDFTDDGGATWSIDASRAPLLIRRPPYALYESNAAPTFVGEGVMAAMLGTELRVQSSWKSIKPRGLESVLQIEFVNPVVGWARTSSWTCPSSGSACIGRQDLLRTADGGYTWEPVRVR